MVPWARILSNLFCLFQSLLIIFSDKKISTGCGDGEQGEKERRVNCDLSFKEFEGTLSQDFEDETGGYNGKVLERRDDERWGQGKGCTEKYRVKTINQRCLYLGQ